MVEGLDALDDAVVDHGEESTSSGGSRSRRPSVDKPPEGAARLLFDLLADDDANEDVTLVAFADDAEEQGRMIPEGVVEAYDLPDSVTTFSWEDLLGLDLSGYEYVGYPPRDRGGESATYEEGWDTSDFTGDITGDTKDVLNGYFAEEIQERFGVEGADEDNPSVAIAIRVPPKSKYDGDFEEQHKHQRIYIQDAATSALSVLKARRDVGHIEDSEFEKLADDNGYVKNDSGNWTTSDDN
jgi:hypothetical protein